MENLPIPEIVTNVKAFLGLTGYYHKYIPGYAKIVDFSFNLTKKECKFVWTPIYQGGICYFKEMSNSISSFNQVGFFIFVYSRRGLVYEGGGSHPVTKV
jgi:hypothetical protein